MSRHQLYRNYDYENDMDEFDGEDGDGEDEMSPEDREIMRDATAAVRTVLGDRAGKVTEAQIQEALWHYYYDVDKSVTYLTKTFIDPAPDKKAMPKKEPQDGSQTHPPRYPIRPPAGADRASIAAFFHDMPWLSVPPSRQTHFVPPRLPRGGLLGGSGAPAKMSKLQALAAQRKRKAEEAKKAKEAGGGTAGGGQPDADVRALRNKATKLAISDSAQTRRTETGAASPEQPPAPLDAPVGPLAVSVGPPPQPDGALPADSPMLDGHLEPGGTAEAQDAPRVGEAPLVAQPSAFAQSLFGPKKHKALREARSELLAVPSLSRAPPSAFDAFLEPSPDDVVLDAQSKAFKKTAGGSSTPTKKKGPAGGVDALASSVSKLKVDFSPLPKSKNLNVPSEFAKAKLKRNANFVVVGHVDAGKSTMMARLLLDMRVVDQRTVDKYQKEAQAVGKSSFALAWVLDSGADERTHGVTIDVATRHFETPTTAFTILDAPGHRDFIPNMIAGASQADFAILVVDAKTGAFESGIRGQTREHALLLRSMGVSRIIVAVNKLDTVAWSQARFDEIVHQVRGFLSATGFRMANVSFVPVAGLLGDNLVSRSTAAAASWYTGGTLLEELEKSEPLPRALDRPLRLPVSEVFKTAGSAITVAGRIEAGSLQVGDALLVVPGRAKAHVKSLARDGQPADWAVAGQNVVVNLANVDPLNVHPGVVLCDPAKPAPCVDVFTMKALAFEPLFPMPVEVHRGRLNEAGVVRELTAVLHKTTGKVLEKTPLVVKPGNVARIRVRLNKKIPLEAGQRVVLRAEGQTVAAGLLE